MVYIQKDEATLLVASPADVLRLVSAWEATLLVSAW